VAKDTTMPTTTATEAAPLVLEETLIVAERPRARPVIAPTATGATCTAWRATEAGPGARATSASEVRSCNVVEVAAEPVPAKPAVVAPRVPQPTMVFDYAIDAPR
jgi:hypothetical protein